MHMLRTYTLALAVALGLAQQASAATNIQPPWATLTAENPSATLTIGNERSVPAGYDIEALGWEQTPSGEVLLPATTGIRVEPPSLEIPPNGSAQLHITALDKSGTAEKVYRIRIRERTDRPREKDEEQVQVISIITLPVFLTPPQVEAKARLEVKPLTDGKVELAVINSGTGHTYVGEVSISGKDKEDRNVFSIQRQGWYVLANGRLEFTATLSARDCRASKTISIAAKALQSDDVWQASIAPHPAKCGRGKITEFPLPGMTKLAPK